MAAAPCRGSRAHTDALSQHVRRISSEPWRRCQVRSDHPHCGIDPGVWTVEAITYGGDIEYESFMGPDAQGRAREYARHKYPGQK